MPAGTFKSWQDGGGVLRWIEFDDYARRVFAGNPQNWLRDSAIFIAAITQALGVVSTQVISIDAMGPFTAAARAAPGASDVVGSITAMLEDGAAHAFLHDVVKALAHRFSGSSDLVLKLPVPRDLLLACGAAADDAEEFDHLDDVGMTLCNLLRPFAETPIGGLLLTAGNPAGLSAEECEAYGPILASARHYDWYTALVLATPAAVELPEIDCDVFLYPHLGGALIGAMGAHAVGGGLDERFWSGTGPATGENRPFVYYGVIPESAEPERVLERIRELESI